MVLLGRTPSFALVGTLLLPACADDGNADAAGSTEATTASGPDTNTATSADSTTGAEMLCNGWSERDPDTPWLELYGASGQPLASGGILALACGGQGSWMFPIFPEMGGWQLDGSTIVFSVEVVVEGFPGPFGSFYDEDDYIYDLGCFAEDTLIGGFSHDCIAVLPPDDTMLTMIDGATGTVHVELPVDGGDPLVIDLAGMTISAPEDVLASGCTPFWARPGLTRTHPRTHRTTLVLA